MITKITQYMKQHHMVNAGDTLVVGVSGGADSVCLLYVLAQLRENMDLKLICVHVNHMFRATAERDEAYVMQMCDNLHIPCYVKREDVKKYARENGLSFEEAGRKVRYDFFIQIKKECSADKIAVAHNKGDCAETMLFHLFRGSNLKGLGGILPVNGDIIRPLLNVERKEIENYLRNENVMWQEDETNASTVYTRNCIRHEVMPIAEKIYDGAQGRIAETAFELQQIEEYLAVRTEEAWTRCYRNKDEGAFVQERMLAQEHPVIASRIIYRMLEQVSGSAKDLTKGHVHEVMKLFGLQSGRRISLPNGVCAYKTSDGILIRKETCTENRDVTTEMVLLSQEALETGKEVCFHLDGLGTVKARLLFSFDFKNIPEKTYTKWFDYDKIIKCAVFRKRMEGDYLVIHDDGSRKKLKEYFIQEKIPSYKRDEIWLLAEDSHVLWVPGYRISSFYKVSEHTERVLELVIGGRENE